MWVGAGRLLRRLPETQLLARAFLRIGAQAFESPLDPTLQSIEVLDGGQLPSIACGLDQPLPCGIRLRPRLLELRLDVGQLED